MVLRIWSCLHHCFTSLFYLQKAELTHGRRLLPPRSVQTLPPSPPKKKKYSDHADCRHPTNATARCYRHRRRVITVVMSSPNSSPTVAGRRICLKFGGGRIAIRTTYYARADLCRLLGGRPAYPPKSQNFSSASGRARPVRTYRSTAASAPPARTHARFPTFYSRP